MTEAIVTAYKLGSQLGNITKQAHQLWEDALHAFKQSKSLSWAPAPKDFEYPAEQIIPTEIIRHMNTLIPGQ